MFDICACDVPEQFVIATVTKFDQAMDGRFCLKQQETISYTRTSNTGVKLICNKNVLLLLLIFTATHRFQLILNKYKK